MDAQEAYNRRLEIKKKAVKRLIKALRKSGQLTVKGWK